MGDTAIHEIKHEMNEKYKFDVLHISTKLFPPKQSKDIYNHFQAECHYSIFLYILLQG